MQLYFGFCFIGYTSRRVEFDLVLYEGEEEVYVKVVQGIVVRLSIGLSRRKHSLR